MPQVPTISTVDASRGPNPASNDPPWMTSIPSSSSSASSLPLLLLNTRDLCPALRPNVHPSRHNAFALLLGASRGQ